MRSRQTPFYLIIGTLVVCGSLVANDLVANDFVTSEPSLEYGPLPADLVAVPQNLLALGHTPEVQNELKFDSKKLAQWETALRDIDKIWWPARLLPADQQRKIIAELETKLIAGLERIDGKNAVRRLRQIELQSQAARVLVRPEVAKYLQLDAGQLKKLADMFAETDNLGKSITPTDEQKLQQLASVKQEEPKKALAVLKPEQAERLRKSFGEPLDTTKVERIYPFAPELIESQHWVGAPVNLASLRGKVVVLHFYAFQCHNCVANFKHYKRWDDALKSSGVEVIGIQRPETSAERDPGLVTAAAKKEGFKFPVLIDLEDKNWNAWGNTMWPTVYIIDRKGYIRFWWQGELNWQGATADKKVEEIIAQLLKEDA